MDNIIFLNDRRSEFENSPHLLSSVNDQMLEGATNVTILGAAADASSFAVAFIYGASVYTAILGRGQLNKVIGGKALLDAASGSQAWRSGWLRLGKQGEFTAGDAGVTLIGTFIGVAVGVAINWAVGNQLI